MKSFPIWDRVSYLGKANVLFWEILRNITEILKVRLDVRECNDLFTNIDSFPIYK